MVPSQGAIAVTTEAARMIAVQDFPDGGVVSTVRDARDALAMFMAQKEQSQHELRPLVMTQVQPRQ